jgi:hypothetical protein
MRRRHTPYADRLGEQLDTLAAHFDELLDVSTIEAATLDETDSNLIVVAAGPWQWGPSSPEANLLRMKIKGDYIDWYQRLHLLFPHPTPEVARDLHSLDAFMRSWLDRGNVSDRYLPETPAEAKTVAAERFDRFRAMLAMVAPAGGSRLRIIPDTNSILRNPDFATYGRSFGEEEFTVHLVPTVLAELDKIKDQGRTPDVREKSRRFNKHVKGLRDKGNLASGVTLTKTITVKTEAKEVDVRGTLDWLDPDVNDDRIAATALRLQSDHPGDTVVLVTSDLGLQTKADAIGLAYEETPPATEDLQAKLRPSIKWVPGSNGSHVLEVTLANKGRVAARNVAFSIRTTPDGRTQTFKSPPWEVDQIRPDGVAVETLSMFTDDGIVAASWADDDGDHSQEWSVEADPPPDPPPVPRARSRIR